MTTDLLILTIYFIFVAYVIYQMALSVEAKLEDRVKIILEKEILRAAIATQLQQQGTDGITIEVPDTGPHCANCQSGTRHASPSGLGQ